MSTLLGETVAESEADEVKALSEKLEIINLQFARRKAVRRADLHWLLIAGCGGILAVAAVLAAVNSPYLGVANHAFEWGFVRLAPFALIVAMVGVFLTRKNIRYELGECTTEHGDNYHRTNIGTESRAESLTFCYAESRRTV